MSVLQFMEHGSRLSKREVKRSKTEKKEMMTTSVQMQGHRKSQKVFHIVEVLVVRLNMLVT